MTTDGWSSKYTQESYSTITLHYADPTSIYGNPKRIVLETLPFGTDLHTGRNIKNKIEACLNLWKIKGILIYLVNSIIQ